jgi:hypothetical protein
MPPCDVPIEVNKPAGTGIARCDVSSYPAPGTPGFHEVPHRLETGAASRPEQQIRMRTY